MLLCSNCRQHSFPPRIKGDQIQILCDRCTQDPSWIYRFLAGIDVTERRYAGQSRSYQSRSAGQFRRYQREREAL